MPASDFDPTVLISPLSELIAETGTAVAEAAQALSEANLALLQNLPEPLKQIGYIPTWYELTTAEVELSIAVHLEETRETQGGGARKWGLFAAPQNAQYQNSYEHRMEGRSAVKVRFAPTPPPAAFQPAAGEDAG